MVHKKSIKKDDNIDNEEEIDDEYYLDGYVSNLDYKDSKDIEKTSQEVEDNDIKSVYYFFNKGQYGKCLNFIDYLNKTKKIKFLTELCSLLDEKELYEPLKIFSERLINVDPKNEIGNVFYKKAEKETKFSINKKDLEYYMYKGDYKMFSKMINKAAKNKNSDCLDEVDLFGFIEELIEDDKISIAKEFCKILDKNNNNKSDLSNIQIKILMAEQKFAGAIILINKTINKRNEVDAFDLYVLKGICLYNIAKYQEALKCFIKAKSISNDNVSVTKYIGDCYKKLGDMEKAFEYYSYVYFSDDVDFMVKYGAKEEIEEILESETVKGKVIKNNNTQLRMDDIEECFQSGSYGETIVKINKEFDHIFLYTPQEIDVLNYFLGMSYFMEWKREYEYKLGELIDFLRNPDENINESLFVDFLFSPKTNKLDIVYPKKFSFDENVSDKVNALLFNASENQREGDYEEEVYEYENNDLFETKRKKDIMKYLDNAIESLSKSITYKLSLSCLITIKLYIGEYEKVVDLYKIYSRDFTNEDFDVLLAFALAHYQMYRMERENFHIEEKYFEEYKKIIESIPQNANEELLLKYKNIVLEDKEEGDKKCYLNKIVYYKNILKESPNDYLTLNNLGDALYKTNDIDEARKFFEMAFIAKKDNPIKNKIIEENIEISKKKEPKDKKIHEKLDILLKNQNNQIEQDREHHKLTQNIDSKMDRMLSIVSSMDHEISDIKNMRRDDEQKFSLMFSEIEKASEAIKENQLDKLEKYENMLKETIVNWDKMEVLNKENLPIAEYIYDMLNKIPESDFAAVIIQYCKGLEKELFEKFFSPFVVYIKNQYNEETLKNNLKEDLDNRKSQKFAEQLLYSKPRFALGEMITILQHANNNKKLSQSWLLKQFQGFVLRISNNILEIVLKSSQMLGNMIDYRNKAAHANEKIDRKNAEDCRKEVPKEINDILDKIE